MHARATHQDVMNAERGIARNIPYSSHVSPTTIVTPEGDFLRIWRVDGITYESTDPEDIQRRLDELNQQLMGLASTQVAVWVHNVRRRITDRLPGEFDSEFLTSLDEKYYAAQGSQPMMANELYFSLIYRPALGVGKAARRAARRSLAELVEDQKDGVRKLNLMGDQLQAGLSRYGFEPLGVYTASNGSQCSSALEFLNYLVSGEWQRVRLPKGPINQAIGSSYVFVGVESIEIRTHDRSRFAQFIDFKDYPEWSEPGLLNSLMYLDSEYVMTHSYSFMSKRDGKDYLKKQQDRLKASEDGAVRQLLQISDAIESLISGHFAMGEYHYSLMMYGDTRQEATENTNNAMRIIKDAGFMASLVATATDAAFFAQLPANWGFRPRIAGITSLNFAGLAPLHNFGEGKRDGNPWGQALTLLRTPQGQPFYFNFHASKLDDDATDKKVLGNTRIIGASGTGKTVLMNFLHAQLQKYATNSPTGFATVFFDKDRGAELYIRAIGGRYLAIKNGEPTGFNPFQMEPTEANILFLEKWVRDRCRGEAAAGIRERLTAEEEAKISMAVRTVMTMPRRLRSITTLLQNMTMGVTAAETANALTKRLQKWCRGDTLGWVADCEEDLLDFSECNNFGFDGTAFLDNPEVRDAISSYLLHRMEDVIDGRRFVYFMDELWKWVDSEEFSEFAGNKQLTIRKQNGLGVFASQMPSSVLKSKIGAALVQQTATEIYLPNNRADRDEYVDGFKVTHAEFEIIKSLADDSRMFLVKQGHSSALAQLSLGKLRDEDGNVLVDFDDELAILSGSSDNVELLDEIREEVGDAPADWLPVFHKRRNDRKSMMKRSVA